MIEIEFEKPVETICDCCGDKEIKLTRFVNQNGNAFAVYFAKFTVNHTNKVVYGLMGLGQWGEGSIPADRTAFSFRIWTDHNRFQVGLTDKNESPWNGLDYFGRILDRQEALAHPRVKDVFHITDHIVTDDKMIIDYFSNI